MIFKKTHKLQEYFELLLESNIKYSWWYEADIINHQGPFYYDNKEAPSIQRMQKEGINCAGFLNVCFRHLQINYQKKVVEPRDGSNIIKINKKIIRENFSKLILI